MQIVLIRHGKTKSNMENRIIQMNHYAKKV